MSENTGDKSYRRVSVGGWIGTLLLSLVPGVNFILWIVWAFAAKRPSRKTFAIACLILTLIFVAAALLAITLFGEQMLIWARTLDPELFTRRLA